MSTPEEAERLRAEIERTREELGETVQALAHKTDVQARAKEKVQETTEAAREKVQETAEVVREKLQETTEAVREKVQETTEAVREKLQETRDAAQERARQVTQQAAIRLPEPVRSRGQQAVASAQRQPIPVIVSLLATLVALRVLLRRRRLVFRLIRLLLGRKRRR